MPILKRTCGYISILIISACLLVGIALPAHGQASKAVGDTTAAADTTEVKVKKPDNAGHQLTLGIDLYQPIKNQRAGDRYGYEIAGCYYLRNEYYAAAEGGWGGAQVAFTDLNYKTTNQYLRLGFNKSILARESHRDWDMMFVGFRGAASSISRQAASYLIIDSLWGNQPGTTASSNFMAYWLELTGGVRVEVVRGLMAGWNIRAKFMMNSRSFQDLQPLFIAGFGKGDTNAAFDINMYLSYAIRWPRKAKLEPVAKKKG